MRAARAAHGAIGFDRGRPRRAAAARAARRPRHNVRQTDRPTDCLPGGVRAARSEFVDFADDDDLAYLADIVALPAASWSDEEIEDWAAAASNPEDERARLLAERERARQQCVWTDGVWAPSHAASARPSARASANGDGPAPMEDVHEEAVGGEGTRLSAAETARRWVEWATGFYLAPTPPPASPFGFHWLDCDAESVLFGVVLKSTLEVQRVDPVPPSALPHHGQAVKIGDARGAIDFGHFTFCENSLQPQQMVADAAYFENIVSHPAVDSVMTETNVNRITMDMLGSASAKLQPYYQLYQTMNPDAAAVDFGNPLQLRAFVRKINVDSQPVGMRVFIGTLVEQQRALTSYRGVCKAWSEQFRKHIFLPYIDAVESLHAKEKLTAHVSGAKTHMYPGAELLPYLNCRVEQRFSFHVKRVGLDERDEYLPATFAWALKGRRQTAQVTVCSEVQDPSGLWRSSGAVEVPSVMQMMSRTTPPWESTKDKLMPETGYRVVPQRGRFPVLALAHKPVPWFKMHTTNSRALITLLYKRTGTLQTCPKKPVSRPHWTASIPRQTSRQADLLEHVACDISIPFNMYASGAKQAGAKKGTVAPVRLRLEFKLGSSASSPVYRCAPTKPFYAIWCDANNNEVEKMRTVKKAQRSGKRTLTDVDGPEPEAAAAGAGPDAAAGPAEPGEPGA